MDISGTQLYFDSRVLICINSNVKRHVVPSGVYDRGCSLSHYLFLLCAEALSSFIRHAEVESKLLGIKCSQSGPKEDTQLDLQNYLGLSRANSHEIYLGLLSVVGRNKRKTFSAIKDKLGINEVPLIYRRVYYGVGRVFYHALPSCDNLLKRNIVVTPHCARCRFVKEDLPHALFFVKLVKAFGSRIYAIALVQVLASVNANFEDVDDFFCSELEASVLRQGETEHRCFSSHRQMMGRPRRWTKLSVML
ncbi:hypothetical protein TorRG33x02_049220 [Trema orientale]|uniref:Uncharacterized protein n=1 Tax=Trema orientale TaxID=63057 RepID=A0A2P5FNL2_TREOI|nr:hypothetical protein TorRG33x02_049220 [Trema orientale]